MLNICHFNSRKISGALGGPSLGWRKTFKQQQANRIISAGPKAAAATTTTTTTTTKPSKPYQAANRDPRSGWGGWRARIVSPPAGKTIAAHSMPYGFSTGFVGRHDHDVHWPATQVERARRQPEWQQVGCLVVVVVVVVGSSHHRPWQPEMARNTANKAGAISVCQTREAAVTATAAHRHTQCACAAPGLVSAAVDFLLSVRRAHAN